MYEIATAGGQSENLKHHLIFLPFFGAADMPTPMQDKLHLMQLCGKYTNFVDALLINTEYL